MTNNNFKELMEMTIGQTYTFEQVEAILQQLGRHLEQCECKKND